MAAVQYSADPAEALRIASLDGLTILYQRRSGRTHILAEPAPQIVATLQGEPLDIATLTERLSDAHGLVVDADTASALADRLDELEESGLVWRA